VRDGIEQKEYPIIFDVSFSPNGESMAYRARVVSGDMVVRDGVEGERFKTVEHQSITFSPDSKRFAYKVISGSNEFIVLDNVRGKKYKGVGYPAFSADSKHLAYVAADAKGWRIVMDGRTSGAYESILNRETLRFDHSGAISFIAIRKGEAFRVRVDS
jgi:WD40 repeat protein